MGEAASENSLTSSNLIRLMPILNKTKREILPAKADAIKADAISFSIEGATPAIR